MAFRIHESVVRGELDNTHRGVVTGRVWLVGRDAPLVLELAGNCWRDLAGRRCTFANPHAVQGDLSGLSEEQTGEVGDMTASRKVRVPDLPISEWLERKRQGLPAPEHMANSIYLEWYSDQNGRVVIESADYNVEVSLPVWEMTEDEEQRQQELNSEAMLRFMNRLEAALRPDKRIEPPENREMDEHEWERFLQQCDARTERFSELLDKFEDHPDRERIVAQHMGWDRPVGGLADQRDDEFDESEDIDGLDLDDWEPPEPDPETEGINWIRTERGDIRHPLQHRCHELGMKMFFDARDRGFKGDDAKDPDGTVCDMVFEVQRTATKLAGALNGVAEGMSPEAGFVVAYLKRALGFLNDALGTMERAEAQGKMTDLIPHYRREALEVRAGIIDLMDQFRQRMR